MEQDVEIERVEQLRLYGQIQRIDEEEQMVYGVATTETPVEDFPGLKVVLDYQGTKRAAQRWQAWGNIREMHQPSAVGVAREITPRDEERDLFIGAHVVDDGAWEKVKAGVYRGFSINAQPEKWQEERDSDIVRVMEYEIVEVSLVDRPHDPGAKITVWRRKPPKGEPNMTALEQFWRSEMGDADIPEDPEEIRRVLSIKLEVEHDGQDAAEPEEEPAPAEEPAEPATELILPERIARLEQHYEARIERLGGRLDGLKDLIAALTQRVERLEDQPAPLPVAPTGPAEKPIAERIAELERMIQEKKLDASAPEVQEVMQLYHQLRTAQ